MYCIYKLYVYICINKTENDMTTINELKEGTWFNVDSQEYKNSYKLIGECEPKVYAAECNGELIEFTSNIEVTKIDGMQLYLLQGGRDWD